MKNTVNFCLLLLFIIGNFYDIVDTLSEQYISLISDVHKYYKPSSVWFSFSPNSWQLKESASLIQLTRDLSRYGIFSMMINFDELQQRTIFYRHRIARPLIVVMLTSISDIDEFNGTTSVIDMSYPVWLIIFNNQYNEPDLCEYCDYPTGNIFNLRFNTEMLISCCKNRSINEWWSVGNNCTEIMKFGEWNDNDKFIRFTNQGLYARRHNLNGAGLRVGIVTSSAFFRQVNGKISGLLGDVLTELKRAINFTIISTIRETGFGSWDSKKNTWSGVVGYVARGQADIGVGEFTITDSRLNVVDFTLPLMLSPNRLYIKKPDRSGVQWTAYFEAFALGIWLTIIFLITISPFLLTTVVRAKRTSSLSDFLIFVENYLYVWGIFCQQGLSDFPAETSLRVAFTSIFFSAVVVSAAYSASLISFLTVYSASLPFYTLSGFAKDGSYKLIVYQNSSDYDLFAVATDRVLVKMMTQMKPWLELPQTVEQGFEQVCKEKVAFFTTEAGKQTINLLPCKFAAIESGHSDSLAMITGANSQYTGVVNYFIQRFQDNGMINRLKLKYILSEELSETSHDVVTLGGIAPVLTVLAGGIVLALAILFVEKIYFHINSERHRGAIKVRKTVIRKKFHDSPKKRWRSRKLRAVVGYYP